MSHVNKPCNTYECVMSHIWMRRATHSNQSCHTYEWVMSRKHKSCHMWTSHETHTNASYVSRLDICVTSRHMYLSGLDMWHDFFTCERAMKPIWMRRVTHLNALRHTFEWVTSRIWMRHITHVSVSCLKRHVPHMSISRHKGEWDALNVNEPCHV